MANVEATFFFLLPFFYFLVFVLNLLLPERFPGIGFFFLILLIISWGGGKKKKKKHGQREEEGVVVEFTTFKIG